jgi:hypothetical protein
VQKKDNNPKAQKATIIETLPPPPITGITIEFPHNTAQTLESAIEEAKKIGSFDQFGTGKKAIYRISFPDDQVYKALTLVEHMRGWRKRIVYANGEKVAWDSVFDFVYCYERKLSSIKPEYYCFGYESEYDFNLWGCKETYFSFREGSQLFTFGKWLNKDGDWQFDKKMIKQELAKKLYALRYCPAMNPSLIQEVIDAFPSVVNPKTNKNWKFVEAHFAGDGDTIPVMIKQEG